MSRAFRRIALCCLVVLLALAPGTARAGQKERLLFRAQPAGAYPAKDAHEGLIVAADPFDTPAKSSAVFGKLDLRRIGILPILLVITNDTNKTVRMDKFSVLLITRDRQKLEPTPGDSVARRLRGKDGLPGDRTPSPLPKIPRRSSRNDTSIEVQVHEFNMRMVLPNSSASGFLYFDVGRSRDWVAGSKVYLTDLVWANNSQPLMYFEVQLDDALIRK